MAEYTYESLKRYGVNSWKPTHQKPKAWRDNPMNLTGEMLADPKFSRPDQEVDHEVRKLMCEQPATFKTYKDAFDHVMKYNTELKRVYAFQTGGAGYDRS